MGSIVGAMLVALLAYRLVSWFFARRLAKIGKENEYHNFDFKGFSDIGSNLSFFDASSSMIAKPISRRGSIMMLQPPQLSSVSLPDILTSTGGSSDNSFSGNEKNNNLTGMVTSQGHTYRDTIVGGNTRRGSMFISPVMAMMNKNSGGEMTSYYDYNANSSVGEPESPMLNFEVPSVTNSSTHWLLDDSNNSDSVVSATKKSDNRPPSQYLEDLLDNF